MIKNNKWRLIIASLIILLPVLAGLILWNELPDSMAVHWGSSGNTPDGYAGKAFAVFGIPCIFLALFWLCVIASSFDKKNKDQNKKALSMIIWLLPVLTTVVNVVLYLVALGKGKEINMNVISAFLFGFLFIFIGNYMPKCKQNFTLGIKVKWTLESEKNWNATHRFAGKLWFIGGFVMLFGALLPEKLFIYPLLIIVFPLVFAPMIYSYVFYKKQLREDPSSITPMVKSKGNKIALTVSLIFVAAILIFVGILMFTGDVNVSYTDADFTIEASYYQDLTVKYEEIDNVEYRENFDKGTRIYGYGSARLLLGTFKNEEFGNYTLYSYATSAPCIIITSGDKKLVIGLENAELTKAAFDEISKNIG
ncbi:MAG: DUF1648 domain-containing protein [Ruminococcaceae bacterium]|nr:DUF1648 domain-containing protein [Oscillospiraceae bacterium]